MSIQLYNTLTRKKEPLETLEPGKVKMYVCGPTVYNKAHIGHAMSAMVFDIIRRYLEYRGYEVAYAMNFTDVDDKIIRRANEMGVDPFKLAEGYIKDFQKDMQDLNIKPATYNPRATQEIDEIIKIVQGLVDKGYAYPLDGDVYFRVRKDPGYGKLSGRNPDDMRAGYRKEVDDRKEDSLDFALWKSAKPGEPSWNSPWGPGRPGWHIECSAMNHHLFGDSIDIHGGGNDLIFPHHENEIAQSECFTGKPFARYWIHNGMLRLGNEKMSKSIGNVISIQDFLKKHSANSFRYLILNSAYRNPILFDDDTLGQAEKAVDRMKSCLKPANPKTEITDQAVIDAFNAKIAAVKEGFIEDMTMTSTPPAPSARSSSSSARSTPCATRAHLRRSLTPPRIRSVNSRTSSASSSTTASPTPLSLPIPSFRCLSTSALSSRSRRIGRSRIRFAIS